MITTVAYPEYATNPPGISFMGTKTWEPGKRLQTFITGTFGVSAKEQAQLVEQIGQAMAETGPLVREAMREHPGFADTGKRMLLAWQQGLSTLYDKRIYALGEVSLGEAFNGFSDPPPVKKKPRRVIGRSDLLSKR